ncbi:cupredoxin domain-containing protein [Paenibacillus sp. IB182496]|uniref:Cupredoxin domain-containing protein n=1 Tax=Paenibacillus sabuli TaxID=2772509 RepID=A0A927BSE5_9BACL|nr:cupredoxin domain-containing protein [Paenibacillus sabuli]MBD2844895.1 cupredoxin domain-containing protein [Paenibacillus sabuli]
MSKIYVVSRKQLKWAAVLLSAAVALVVYLGWDETRAVSSAPSEERVIHLITTEFKTTTADGKALEVYRFDPGTVVVQRGEPTQLNITGVNGQSHPFVIEGLDIRGEVKKGETTVVRFTAEKPGTYPIVCLTHKDLHQGGPMVGYLVVQ